ncbi:MAG: redoxin domain-containing protein [Thermomicrobiales bacterium]|nr:redoxin domain-containing protein [Thermomicrobiales bacterium]MCO5221256.1 redoxin domain-containing protein [Thermomicrobiales bacterium]
MAESIDAHSGGHVAADNEHGDHSPPTRRKQALAGLGVAAGILILAWFVAGRAGLSDVGKGGINTSLLPKVGDEAPDFVAVSPMGDVVHLSDFKGQPVWLNFWGAWCPPCRAEMPDIQAAYEQLGPQGLTLLAISLGDKPSEAINFAELNGVTFDILLDPDRSLTSPTYPIYNFPTHIFIDENGIVQKIVLAEMSADQAIEAAQSILPEQTASTNTRQ